MISSQEHVPPINNIPVTYAHSLGPPSLTPRATTTTQYQLVPPFVTESTKTAGLKAYRQVLRKAGFNYSECCSLPMAEASSIEFSHIIQQYLTFKTIL